MNKYKMLHKPSREMRNSHLHHRSALKTCVVALLLTHSSLLYAAENRDHVDLGPNVSDYQAFLVYPHLHKAFSLLHDGQPQAALAQMKHANELLPGNAMIALYLAENYLELKQPEKAANVLVNQLKITPDNLDVKERLTQINMQLHGVTLNTPCHTLACSQQQIQLAINQNKLDLAQNWLQQHPANEQKALLAQHRALLERAIYLQKWDLAKQQLQQLAQWNELQPNDIQQWLQILLQEGNATDAYQLQKRYHLTNPGNELVIATLFAKEHDQEKLTHYLAQHRPVFTSAKQEQEWLGLLAKTPLLAAYTPYFAQNHAYQSELLNQQLRQDPQLVIKQLSQLPDSVYPEQRFSLGLSNSAHGGILNYARNWIDASPQPFSALDSASYRLLQAGRRSEAANLLTTYWPFSAASPTLRHHLIARLILLADDASASDRTIIARDTHNSALREAQAEFFFALKDCQKVQQLLPIPADYSVAVWSMLAQCYSPEQSKQRLFALEKIGQLDPSVHNLKQLAYQAAANDDHLLAFTQWQKIPDNALNNDARLAAISSALAIDKKEQARQWLQGYIPGKDAGDDAEYWWFHFLLDAPSQQYPALERAIALAPQAKYYAAQAHWLSEHHDVVAAINAMQLALTSIPASASTKERAAYHSQMGFLYLQAQRPAEAEPQLRLSYQDNPASLAVLEQLVFTEQKLANNSLATQYAEEAINRLMALPASEQNSNSLFTLRQLHEDLNRRWTFSYGGWTGTQPGSIAIDAGGQRVNQNYAQLEAAYRLGSEPIRDGKTVEIYTRLFSGNDNGIGLLPVSHPIAGVGLRWKPLGDYTIYLSAEQQIPLAATSGQINQTLLRASGSFFSLGGYGDHYYAPASWRRTQNLYLDSAYYTGNKSLTLVADYHAGMAYQYHPQISIEPYTHLQGTQIIHANDTLHDVRAGIGLQVTAYFGGNRYNSNPHNISAGVEYQHAISTYQDEKQTLMFTLSTRW